MTSFAALLAVIGMTAAPQLPTPPELPRVAPAEVGLKAEPLERLGPALVKLAEEGAVPGGVALVVRGGKVAYVQAFGQRDLATKSPMTEDTIFAIASMTKPVTCVAAMILIEEGKLKLDDPVGKHLPEMAEMRVLGDPKDDTAEAVATVPTARPVTIRHLFTHTAGFTYGGLFGGNPRIASAYQKVGLQSRSLKTVADQVVRLSKAPLAHQPGDGWTYGYSHDVLGRVVEVVSGRSLAEFMADRIFRPLDLRDTSFEVPQAKRDRLATIYNKAGDAMAPLPRNFGSPTFFAGGAGLFSTARDYARFAAMLAGGGSLGAARILKPESVAMMTTNQIGGRDALGGVKYGLGFGLVPAAGDGGDRRPPRRFFWGGIFSTNFWVDPGNEVVAVLMTQVLPTNSGGANGLFEKAVAESLGGAGD